MRFLSMTIAVAAVAGLAVVAPAGEEKTSLPGMGSERQMLKKADPTTAGSFDGTWMYVNRDMRWAMWVRTKDGVPQVRLQFQSLANPEAFETDWGGKALYYLAGTPVSFELKLGAANADQILGAWSWSLRLEGTGRVETADVVINRTGFGRNLQVDFQNYQKIITKNGKDQLIRMPVAWTWTKLSKRELLWDELPF